MKNWKNRLIAIILRQKSTCQLLFFIYSRGSANCFRLYSVSWLFVYTFSTTLTLKNLQVQLLARKFKYLRNQQNDILKVRDIFGALCRSACYSESRVDIVMHNCLSFFAVGLRPPFFHMQLVLALQVYSQKDNHYAIKPGKNTLPE